jgi:hypothetical protein
MASSLPPSSLEQLLVERAKAIRQANPALKAFAEIQGKYFGLLHFICPSEKLESKLLTDQTKLFKQIN